MPEQFDHEGTIEPVCPWCGHEYTNDGWADEECDMDCDECGKMFHVEVTYDVTYSTEKTEE